MKNRHQVTPRTLCLIRNGEKILLIEFSKEKGDMQGFYNAPGGHVEFNEGIIECAKKEIFEETGLKPNNTKLKGIVHITNFFGKNVMLFVTLSDTDEKNVIECSEGKLHWIDIDKINEVNIIKDVKIIIDKINELDENEIFTAKSKFDGKGKLLKMDFE